MNLDEIRRLLKEFTSEREWGQFHTPKNLAMAVAAEAGELLSEYRWLTPEGSEPQALTPEALQKIEAEIADVGISLLLLCERLGISLEESLARKIEVNRRNYPVGDSRGVADRKQARVGQVLPRDLQSYESIGSCGPISPENNPGGALRLAVAYLRIYVDGPPDGYSLGLKSHYHELGEYQTICLFSESGEFSRDAWIYYRACEKALLQLENHISWMDLAEAGWYVHDMEAEESEESEDSDEIDYEDGVTPRPR